MDLKEIQLTGFKSFADKTTIRFDDGVTCIVGPNGCGKSNVADAVRWVLGEQSSKALRGSNMQDVIFGGTAARKPHTFCEVTLVFDNSRKIFALDSEEVSMTRRLYRNGDSKYLINNQASRLKDIVTLFHSIGLGKEGYSIIGQGKVQQIMGAKPEDRRLIFEEATGLMTFKSKKQEIERKIDDSNNNLYIYRQRIDETERRLGPLSKQADAAREYDEYFSSLRTHEANTYIYRYENAETEKDKYRKEIATVSEKIIALNTEQSRINRQLEDYREKILSADEEIAALHEKHVLLSVGNERKDGELKLIREKINTYRNQIQEAEAFLESGKARVTEIDEEIVRLTVKGKEDSARLAEMETEQDVLSSAIATLDSKIEVFERLSDEQRQSQISSAENLSELKKNQGTLTARKEATQDRIAEVKEAIKKSEDKKGALEDELASVKKDLNVLTDSVSGGMREIEEQQDEAREMQLTVNNFNQELFKANGELASLHESLEMYISLKNRFDGYKESTRRLLSVAKTNGDVSKRICGALADIIKTEQKYETAIETALGGAMQNIVVPTMDDGRWLIEYLSRTGGGKCTFYPVESMKARPDSREINRALDERGAIGLATELVKYDDYYYNVVSNLLGNTLICDNIASATTIAKKYGSTFKIVTLDGNQTLTSGAMSGGSQDKGKASLLSHERRIEECKEKIAAKQKYIEKIKQSIAMSEQEQKAAEQEVEKLRVKYQDANAEIAALAQRESALVRQIAEEVGTLEVYQGVLKDLQDKLSALQQEEAFSSENEEQLNTLRKGAEEQLATQKSQCEQFKEERAEKDKKLRDLEREYAALSAQMKKEEAEILRLQGEREETMKAVLERQTITEQSKYALENLELELSSHELTEEEKAAVQAIVEQTAQVTKRKEEINAAVEKLEAQKEETALTLTKQTEKRWKSETEIGMIDSRLDSLRERIAEAYELDYEGCLPYRTETFSLTESANAITVLKRKITMLGAINPHAVEEYAEEKARYDEMIAQRDDVQKAVEDLTVILNDIRAEMLRIFNEGFDQINENFKVIFKELFGGGKAELQMDYVEGEDPLDAGVEIVACPPGKTLKKISLLSGGEQALTAIAILFAILKARPMPFCILDEIEAALDEANVDRFASYLKNFSEETQFIVITHRKPTMTQADTLFGVTMQEKGVSKIISVKLAEVESKLGKDAIEG